MVYMIWRRQEDDHRKERYLSSVCKEGWGKQNLSCSVDASPLLKLCTLSFAECSELKDSQNEAEVEEGVRHPGLWRRDPKWLVLYDVFPLSSGRLILVECKRFPLNRCTQCHLYRKHSPKIWPQSKVPAPCKVSRCELLLSLPSERGCYSCPFLVTTQNSYLLSSMETSFIAPTVNAPSLGKRGTDEMPQPEAYYRRAPGSISQQALGLSCKRMTWAKVLWIWRVATFGEQRALKSSSLWEAEEWGLYGTAVKRGK